MDKHKRRLRRKRRALTRNLPTPQRIIKRIRRSLGVKWINETSAMMAARTVAWCLTYGHNYVDFGDGPTCVGCGCKKESV